MKRRIVLALPYPPEVVMRAMTTPQFHIDKVRGLGALSCELLEEGGAGSARFVHIRRRMPGRAPVSGPLAKLLPSEIVLRHRDEWDGAGRSGRIEVQIEGVPLLMRATAAVVATATGSDQCFDWEITASLPLVGGVLERFVAQDLDRSIREEAQVVKELLKQYV